MNKKLFIGGILDGEWIEVDDDQYFYRIHQLKEPKFQFPIQSDTSFTIEYDDFVYRRCKFTENQTAFVLDGLEKNIMETIFKGYRKRKRKRKKVGY